MSLYWEDDYPPEYLAARYHPDRWRFAPECPDCHAMPGEACAWACSSFWR